MPTVKLNKTVFEKLVGKKLPLEKLKDRISMLGTDLESVEGNEINVEIFPNRPDLLSEQGLARAFSSFIGAKPGLRKYKVKKSGEKIYIDKSLKDIRPFTACAIIKNLKFDDEKIREIIQIQEKMHITYGRNRKKVAIGIYPMEKISFPITFKAELPQDIVFQPLEFPKEINALQMLSQHPTGREYGYLLEGFKKFPVFRDSKGNVLSVPPIINSHNVGKISENTKDVFIECSGFNYDVLAKCLNIIVTALADMGGELFSLDLEYPDKKIISPNLDAEKMPIDVNYINSRLGLNLKESEMKSLLENMGFGYDSKKKMVLVPAYRADILHQIDFAEDIAIAYGYENFDEIIPKVATVGQESRIEILTRRITHLLIGLGLIETYSYNITSSETIEKKYLYKKPIMLSNSLSEGYDCIRNSMICSLLDILSKNKHNEYPQRIFDTGTIFTKDTKQETGVKEQIMLSVALCEDKIDFTRIKQILDYLFSNLDIKYSLKEIETKQFLPGRSAEIVFNNKSIGTIGEVHPQVLSNFSLDYPVSVFELNLSELLRLL
jgi:phenylalanyl-tRNA synthetase beta chain